MHISTVHPRYDTRIFHKECVSLAAVGCEVALLVADGLGDEKKDGVQIVDVGIGGNGRRKRMLLGSWRVLNYVCKHKVRAVHLHDPELLVISLLLRWMGVFVIYDMHENLPKQILTKSWLPLWVRRPVSVAVRWFERLALRNIPVVMAEESYIADYGWIRRAAVVQNFPITQYFADDGIEKFETFTVGYIGGVTRDRGVISVLQAISRLRDRGLVVNFECLGPISDEVARAPLFLSALRDGWLHAPGRVDGKDGWKIIARCHVGVAILRPLPNYVNSWPTKMFEYMAMRLPVVVSAFPLYSRLIEKISCGLLVNPDDVEKIASAFEFIMNNFDEAKCMGENGRRAVMTQFSWSHEFRKLWDFYEMVLP